MTLSIGVSWHSVPSLFVSLHASMQSGPSITVCVAERSSDKLPKMIPIAKPVIGEDEISAVTAVLRCGLIAQGRSELWDGKTAETIVEILAVSD